MTKNIEVSIVKLEHEISSVKERIRDVEWKIENNQPVDPDARTKAQDKLRHLTRELTELKVQRVWAGILKIHGYAIWCLVESSILQR